MMPPALAAWFRVDQPCSAGRHVRRAGVAETIAAFMLATVAIPSAQAADFDVVLRHGDAGNRFDRTGVGVRFGPWWSGEWGNLDASLRPELEFGHFRYTGSANGPGNLNEAGGIGLLRIYLGRADFRPYAEIGLGVGLFSRDRLGDKAFSTHFQFSEHLGLGVELGRRWSAGWQFSHYSNAGIRDPNNGITLHQVVVGVRF